MKKKPFIGIAGNIGVGKTTFTSFIAKEFNLVEIYESVTDNPYLSDFYSDMHRWSFNLQIYFLHHRFGSINNMVSNIDQGMVQDRTIYEDVEIFSKNLYKMGSMDKRDWETYSNLFENMIQFIRKPDLIVYLKADLNILIDRINNRDRDYENKIDPAYLTQLNKLYDNWIEGIDWTKTITIDTNNFNIYKDQDKLEKILSDIGELI
tara:strand:+ start:330 stop:947 length:618 start_codon:yes stop_codon:yes gene_type:complete